jgi:uncharacterized protein
MKDLIEYIAKGLVDNPDLVTVDEEREGNTTYLHLQVGEGELGRVIGRDGKLANAMRTLLRMNSRRGRRYMLDIGD